MAKWIKASGLIAIVVASALPTRAATLADKCEVAKTKIAAKYYGCRAKAVAKAIAKGEAADYSACVAKFDDKWDAAESKSQGLCPDDAQTTPMNTFLVRQADKTAAIISGAQPVPRGVLPATGQLITYVYGGDDGTVRAGEPLSYTDNGDGTITDNVTGLMWEKKVKRDRGRDSANLHDADNCYAATGLCNGGGWTVCGNDAHCVAAGDGTNCYAPDCQNFYADGLTIYEWVAQLNAASFAGYDDWRIPNIKELGSIVDYSKFSPKVSSAFHGSSCGTGCADLANPACSCTGEDSGYWSSTLNAGSGGYGLNFLSGVGVVYSTETFTVVRAVRGGL